MNNLTEQEAFVIAEFINEHVFNAIKQDEIDDIEWLATLLHGYEKLSEYCKYDECYDHSKEPKEDESSDFSYIALTPKFDESEEDNPWLNVFWYLASNPLFMGEYDAENGNEQFMNGIETVMEYIAEKAGKAKTFRSIFYDNIRKSLEKAGKF